MGNYDFKRDLAVAKKTEREIAHLLECVWEDSEIIDFEDTNKYDLLVKLKNGTNVKVEIKEDFMCKYTGNVALEFESRGKPSGISVSKADYYLYKIHHRDSVVYTLHAIDVLRDKVKNKKYFRIVNGGDEGSNTMNYLFKYKDFIRNSLNIYFPLDK
jgi:hypothetical protein